MMLSEDIIIVKQPKALPDLGRSYNTSRYTDVHVEHDVNVVHHKISNNGICKHIHQNSFQEIYGAGNMEITRV